MLSQQTRNGKKNPQISKNEKKNTEKEQNTVAISLEKTVWMRQEDYY